MILLNVGMSGTIGVFCNPRNVESAESVKIPRIRANKKGDQTAPFNKTGVRSSIPHRPPPQLQGFGRITEPLA